MLIRADIAAAVVPPGTSLPLGSIDAPVAGRRHTGPSIAVSGWAHAPGRTVTRVEVLLGGERIRAGICRPRPDIAEAFGSAAALLSGFHAEVDLGAAAGRQILRADVRFLDGGRSAPSSSGSTPLRNLPRTWRRHRARARAAAGPAGSGARACSSSRAASTTADRSCGWPSSWRTSPPSAAST